MSARLFHLCFLAFVLLPASAIATTRTWPGAAPCATTLQACVDGATNGDRIEIATNTPIAEDISLYNRSLTLTDDDSAKNVSNAPMAIPSAEDSPYSPACFRNLQTSHSREQQLATPFGCRHGRQSCAGQSCSTKHSHRDFVECER
jgi:hypothetical protein